MKKGLFAVAVGVVFLAASSAGAVTLSPSCGYVFNPATGTPPGFDAMTESLWGILGLLGVSGLPTDWHVADIESLTPGGPLVGDGIPDYIQATLAGAVLCGGDTEILADLNANVTSYNNFLGQLTPIVNSLGGPPTLGEDIATVLSGLSTWGTVHTPALTPAELALPTDLADLQNDLGDVTGAWALIEPLLASYANWFGTLAGLDTGTQNTVTDLLGQLTTLLTEANTALVAAAVTCNTLAGHAEMTSPLNTQLIALATRMDTAGDALAGITAPTWVVLDRPGGGEDFAAAGDPNGDGVTNLTVWNACKSLPDGRAQFVYYAFTPGLVFQGFPVAGVFGLLIMAGGCALAGARSLRKK